MNVVCGTDFGPASAAAEEIAARLALNTSGTAVLVHALRLPSLVYVAGDPLFVAPPSAMTDRGAELEKNAEAELRGRAERFGKHVVPRLAIGEPDTELLAAATDFDAKVVVVGTHEASAPTRWMLGSVADRVVRRSPRPVLVMRGNAEPMKQWTFDQRPLQVIAGVEFDYSFPAVAAALKTIAAAGPCEVTYLHAYDPRVVPDTTSRGDLEAATSRSVDRLVVEHGLPPSEGRVGMVAEKPATALLSRAETRHADLIIVGTHARKGLSRTLLGSVALAVLHRSPCPVLIAPVPS